ncbi:hypothetical protein TTHERM_00388470 (macronuclear) [Tetrahymena thermophila SB210]|uniref:Uncharacterized protein n=1 Tax=Tetrahymena thermophila (strain SB210) TaxID=312017 RepID=Q23RE2_TETTS|nr:hypothetical protein TTHERM_00388470 [Tetrahymena thermophila SB210]EAR99106.1 hypothetical protein TTHERM_00388470 [Tetrahymena thermophila SB210]|eukprot:XP_001019351.1 hypothetical protein TTHERM_00388470 [Tetrahymena thermophila SB210]
MIEFLEQSDKFICQIHRDQIPLFIQVDEDGSCSFQCQVCVAKNSFKSRRLVSIGQIFEKSKKAVIHNWPPLDDSSIYEKIEELFNQQQELSEIEEINKYFKQVKNKIISKLDEIEGIVIKKVNEYSHINLANVYNTMNQKEQIQQHMMNLDTFQQQMKQIIQKAFQDKNSNTQKLINTIAQFDDRYKFDKNVLDKFLTLQLEILGEIEQIIAQKSSQEDNQKLLNEMEKKQVLMLENLGSTILKDENEVVNRFSTKTLIAIEDEIKKNLETFSRSSNSLSDNKQLPDFDKYTSSYSSSSLTFKALNKNNSKSNLQQRITQSIQQKAFKLSKAIQQNGFSFKNIDPKESYYIGFIETYIDPIKNEQFTVNIKNLQNWIGIGLVEKEKINKDIPVQQNSGSSEAETINGYYMLSHNGYFWQQKQQKSQDKHGQFIFKSGDVVTVTIKGNLMVFEKQNYRHKFEIQISLSENSLFYPGFILYSQGDEIEFVKQEKNVYFEQIND